MARPPPRSFLLRLWREQADAPLRATLIDVAQPAEMRHFATLETLLDFLRAQEVREAPTRGDRNAAFCMPSETA